MASRKRTGDCAGNPCASTPTPYPSPQGGGGLWRRAQDGSRSPGTTASADTCARQRLVGHPPACHGDPMITADDIRASAARIAPHVRRTPVLAIGPGTFGLDHSVSLKL